MPTIKEHMISPIKISIVAISVAGIILEIESNHVARDRHMMPRGLLIE
jgi:hypothetical protein